MSEVPPPQYQFQEPAPPKKRFNPWIVVAIVIGACGCGCVPIMAAILFPVFAQAGQAAKASACLSNVKQLTVGFLVYAQDNDDVFPVATAWVDRTKPIVRSDAPYACPVLTSSGYGYSMNKAMSKKRSISIKSPEKTVLLFETLAPKKNASGDPSSDTANPPRHGQRNNFAYADGHAMSLKQ